MKSSHKDGKQNSVSFFTALRRLGREVDQGVKDIQKQLDGRQAACDNNRHLALKGLLARRKEVDTLKSDSRTLVSEMRRRGSDFEQSLQAYTEVVDIQLQQLSSIQAHLIQYGFVPQSECEDSTEERLEKTGSTEEMESPTTPSQKDIKEEMEKKINLTPRLEDFKLSSYTLNMLNQPMQQPSFKVPKPAPLPDSVCGRYTLRSEVSRHDSVPTPFQNQGLTVTPSLFPSQSYGTGNRSTQEAFSLACSPDMMSQGPQEPSDQDNDLQNRQMEVARTLDFSDSPIPPVLQTPGIKQIPLLRESVLAPPGERGHVAQQLKLGDSGKDEGLDSPKPPVLSTPGIQQICKTQSTWPDSHKGNKSSVGGYDPMELPKTPELTYSLKDLEDVTLSFRQADLSSTFSDSRVLRSSENRTSTHTPESYRKVDAGVKAPSLPQQPVLHHFVTSGDLDLPTTPKFSGSYHFMGSKH